MRSICAVSRYSLASLSRCSLTRVPRGASSGPAAISYPPLPSLDHVQAAASPARRVVTSTRSATMKAA